MVHTASPVTINNPRDHDDVIGPAVSGVKNVLEAAQKYKVKRVVITSSVSAVECQGPEVKDGEIFNEKNWTDTNHWDCNAYVKSKTASEKYAWDFQSQLNK